MTPCHLRLVRHDLAIILSGRTATGLNSNFSDSLRCQQIQIDASVDGSGS
jgi:hypothetical protein